MADQDGGANVTNITPEPIMRIATGFMAAKFLFTASEIGLFEALACGPANLEQIATRIAVPRRTAGIVVSAMVSLGMIEQEAGCYRNSAAAAVFLAGNQGPDLRANAATCRRYVRGHQRSVERIPKKMTNRPAYCNQCRSTRRGC
jgi:hypothetical protein